MPALSLTQVEKELLKKAFASPYTIPGQQNQFQQQEEKRKPSVAPWLLGGLALGAGAYGIGKFDPSGMMGGFSKNVDGRFINPAINWIKSNPTLHNFASGLKTNVVNPTMNKVHQLFPSQAPKTETPTPPPTTSQTAPPVQEQPDLSVDDYKNRMQGRLDDVSQPIQYKINQQPLPEHPIANLAGFGANTTYTAADLGGLLSKHVFKNPNPIALKMLGSPAGKLLGTASVLPTGLSLGDYANDVWNVKNPLAQKAITTGVTGTLMSNPVVGGMGGNIVDSYLKHIDGQNMQQAVFGNQLDANSRLFSAAHEQDREGYPNALKAWFGAQAPGSLNSVRMNDDRPYIQKQINEILAKHHLPLNGAGKEQEYSQWQISPAGNHWNPNIPALPNEGINRELAAIYAKNRIY